MSKAREKLLEQAETGDAQAQFELGSDYDFEDPRDRQKARNWYEKAARQNHAGELLRDGTTGNSGPTGIGRQPNKRMNGPATNSESVIETL